MEVVGEADNGITAWQKAKELDPDIVLMASPCRGERRRRDHQDPRAVSEREDRCLDRPSGQRLLERGTESGRVRVCSQTSGCRRVDRRYPDGGEGGQLHRSRFRERPSRSHISITGSTKASRRAKPLSQREVQVLSLVANGYTNKEIAKSFRSASRRSRVTRPIPCRSST
jgi:DNA-binding NarL/FixJ family response regulator